MLGVNHVHSIAHASVNFHYRLLVTLKQYVTGNTAFCLPDLNASVDWLKRVNSPVETSLVQTNRRLSITIGGL